jgi:hypothetical protein
METKSPASLMRGITGISFRQSVIRFWIIQAFIYLNKTQIFTIKEMKVTIHELYFHEWNSKSF